MYSKHTWQDQENCENAIVSCQSTFGSTSGRTHFLKEGLDKNVTSLFLGSSILYQLYCRFAVIVRPAQTLPQGTFRWSARYRAYNKGRRVDDALFAGMKRRSSIQGDESRREEPVS
jgi:hypothetical protein